MARTITPQQLIAVLGTEHCPIVVDVRPDGAYRSSMTRIAGAVWRDHRKSEEWYARLPAGKQLVVYCTHGHNVSALAAERLAEQGANASLLAGGIDAFSKAGGPLVRTDVAGADVMQVKGSVWVTRERPKVDRIACPWLIRRFIDPFATFLFVAPEWVCDVAEELGATPFDVEGVHYSHRGETCSFDTFISEFGLEDPPLLHLARIVRGADTSRLDLEPQAAGLLAVSLGLSATEPDDHRQLEKGLALYDALYGWCRHAVDERHNWPAASLPA